MIDEIKRITAEAKIRLAQEKKKREKFEAIEAKAKAIQEEEKYQEWLKDKVEYIKKEILQSAHNGKTSYQYNLGERPNNRFQQDLLNHKELKEFLPKTGTEQHTEIINYDMGTDRDYYVTVINFSW